MKSSFKPTLYPGAHVKYAVDIFGVTFEPFECSPSNNNVKTVAFEKEEPGNPLNAKCFMTFYLGPVSSLEEAKRISELEMDPLLDIVSFEFLAKISKPRCVGYNLMARPGEGAQGHCLLPPLQMKGTGTTGDRVVDKQEIKNMIKYVRHKSIKNGRLLSLFRRALLIDDVVSQFLMLYLILDVKIGAQNGAQQKIDALLRSLNPNIEESPDPRNLNRKETCYTRLRNEITHRGTNPEKTNGEILERSYDFKRLVKLAIKA